MDFKDLIVQIIRDYRHRTFYYSHRIPDYSHRIRDYSHRKRDYSHSMCDYSHRIRQKVGKMIKNRMGRKRTNDLIRYI